MWQAKYAGPRTDIESVCVPNWREALGAMLGQMKHAAAASTLPTLISETQHAKPDVDWSATDGVHRFSIARVARGDDRDVDALICLHCGQDVEHPVFEGCTHDDCPLPPKWRADPVGSGITHCPPAVVAALPDENVACIAPMNEVIPTVNEPATQPDVDHTAREHSELGGSITERFWNCAGSVRMVRGAPNPETEASRRGTAAHEVAHMCLTNGQDAIEYIGRSVNGVEIDAAIADGVQAYLDDCRECPAADTFYEVRFNLAALEPPAPMFGTSDYVGYDRAEQRLYVKDYKNGYMYVDALGNKQLKYYALGAMLALGDDKPVSDIEITICQPNSQGATLKTDTFDAIDLVEWSQELMAKAHATQDPDAPLAAGPWCEKTFCPVRASCPVHAAWHMANAGCEFDPIRTPEVRLLTPAQRGAIHGAADGLRAFLTAVEESIKADTEGTGWKIVPTRPQEAWLDSDMAAAALQVDHDINPYLPAEVISPAVARGLIKESLHAARLAEHTTGKKPTKKAAEDDARVMLADLITKRSGGTKLVPEADPTPGIPTNGAEFDQVEP